MARSEYLEQRFREIEARKRIEAEEADRRAAEKVAPHPELEGRTKAGHFTRGNRYGDNTGTQWPVGTSGNPKGKARGSKRLLSHEFIRDLSNVWRRRGREVLEELVTSNPAALAALAARYVPPESLAIEQKPTTLTFGWAEGEAPKIEAGGKDWPPQSERPMVVDLREVPPVDVEPLEQHKPVASVPEPEERRRLAPLYYDGRGVI